MYSVPLYFATRIAPCFIAPFVVAMFASPSGGWKIAAASRATSLTPFYGESKSAAGISSQRGLSPADEMLDASSCATGLSSPCT